MSGFDLHEEYKNYNKVVITIDPGLSSEYVISNINLKGIPDEKCGVHLQALTIEPPVYDSGNPSNVGAKGTITVVDYRDAIVNTLINHFIDYVRNIPGVNPNANANLLTEIDVSKITPDVIDYAQLLPTIRIEIYCYIGSAVVYDGFITDWSTQFAGTTPSVSLSWSVICTSNPAQNNEPVAFSTADAKSYFEAVKAKFSTTKAPKVTILKADGTEATWKDIHYPYGKSGAAIGEETQLQNFTRNQIINALNHICETNVFGDSENPIIGRLSNDGSEFFIIEKNPEVDNPNNQDNIVSSNILFIQNGKYKAYSTFKRDQNEYFVVPMTSFTFNTSFKQLALQFNITDNPNGNKMTGGDGQSVETGEPSQTKAAVNSAAKDASASAISVKFECYNIMAFNQYNLNSYINYEVYNEFGVKHISSGKAVVTKVSYDLSGGVIKASVEATQMFNAVISDDPNNKKTIGELQGVKPKSGIMPDGSVKLSPMPSKNDPNYDLIELLRQEDDDPVSLSYDKTESLLYDNNNLFDQAVLVFLNQYAVDNPSSGSRRMIGLSYAQSLITSGNIGLLTLLLAVCNYGVYKDTNDDVTLDQADWFTDLDDVVLKYHGFENRKKWFASDIGKNPYDYKSGGLGIAHWDAENLAEIYQNCGFSPKLSDKDKSELERLFLDVSKDTKEVAKFASGKFTGWSNPTQLQVIPSRFIDRIIPQFSGNCYFRRFDNGLRQSDAWKAWAREILYYRGNTGNDRPYQIYLFRLWVIKFWIPTVNALRNINYSTSGHNICLQDAIRIARAGNSKTSYINKMAGKSVVEQYSIYEGNDDRAVRQKAFCKRCADIVGWALTPDAAARKPPQSTYSSYDNSNYDDMTILID